MQVLTFAEEELEDIGQLHVPAAPHGWYLLSPITSASAPPRIGRRRSRGVGSGLLWGEEGGRRRRRAQCELDTCSSPPFPSSVSDTHSPLCLLLSFLGTPLCLLALTALTLQGRPLPSPKPNLVGPTIRCMHITVAHQSSLIFS